MYIGKKKAHGTGSNKVIYRIVSLFFAFLVFPALAFCQDAVKAQDAGTGIDESGKAFGPQIIIYSPVQNQKLKGFDVMINGEVTDNGEVVSISLGEHSLGVSGSKVPFQKLVSLKDGKNEVHITAVDNDGNKVERILTVFREGFEDSVINKAQLSAGTEIMKQKVKPVSLSFPVLKSKGIIVKRADFIKISAVKGMLQSPKHEMSKDVKVILIRQTAENSHKNINSLHENIKELNVVRSFPRVLLNNTPLQTSIAPVIRNGRTYVALETELVSKMGVHVVRDKRDGHQCVYFYVKGRVVKLTARSKTINANGRDIHVGAQLEIKNGHLMLPFRAVCESLGFKVHWDNQSRTAYLTNGFMPAT